MPFIKQYPDIQVDFVARRGAMARKLSERSVVFFGRLETCRDYIPVTQLKLAGAFDPSSSF
jgi:hypothetical protein